MKQTLRQYQSIAKSRLLDSLGTHRKVLLTLPTGAGKTTVASSIIEESVGRTLFLAHRRELIYQASARLDEHGIDHGIIMANDRRYHPLFKVQVASVQTLTRRKIPGKYTTIIVDEAHHATAKTYQTVIDQNPEARVIGLTATPIRMGGRGLGDLFDDLVIGAAPSELIRDGYLVPTQGFSYDPPNLKGVKVRSTGDYDPHSLTLKMNKPEILNNISGQWEAHSKGKSTIVFASSIEHSKSLVEEFQRIGVIAEHVDGETPREVRDAILGRLKDGQTTVVCNYGVLTEGFDAPTVETIILARPTKSLGLFIQMSGRGCRPACLTCGQYVDHRAVRCPNCFSVNIKRTQRLHDHTGGCLLYGLPLEDRNWTLDSEVRKPANVTNLKACPRCYAVLDKSLMICPVCGFDFNELERIRRRGLNEVEGTTIDLDEVKARRDPEWEIRAAQEREYNSPREVIKRWLVTAPATFMVKDIPGVNPLGNVCGPILRELGYSRDPYNTWARNEFWAARDAEYESVKSKLETWVKGVNGEFSLTKFMIDLSVEPNGRLEIILGARLRELGYKKRTNGHLSVWFDAKTDAYRLKRYIKLHSVAINIGKPAAWADRVWQTEFKEAPPFQWRRLVGQ